MIGRKGETEWKHGRHRRWYGEGEGIRLRARETGWSLVEMKEDKDEMRCERRKRLRWRETRLK